MPREGSYVIHSVTKALDVLFAFREPPHRFTLAELCKLVPFTKNQTYRCVRTLEAYGLLREDERGRYLLSGAVYSLAVGAAEEASVIRVAQPFLDRLATITGESIHLVALVDGMAVAIDRRERSTGLRLATRLGTRAPLHAGAVPKAMLAYLPRNEQERILQMVPFWPRHTERTVSDPDLLRAELSEIRERGYSISDEDYELGARGAGAPIFDATGAVIAGISAGGPSVRVDEQRLHEFGVLVRDVARQISRQLGHLAS